MRLSGKVAVITGAGRGVGRATALRFAEEGAAVVCVDVNGRSAETTAADIAAGGGASTPVAADVASPEGNAEMVAAAVRRFGGLDVLHANAAVQIMGSAESTSAAEWDRVHATNLRGVFLGIQHALPEMRARGGGSIIITASVLGIVGDPEMAAYGATKGGLRSMCRAIAAAHGPENIRCNTICPGDIDTEMVKDYFDHQADPEAARREVTKRYPLRRFASPLDVANVAVFLASDDARYLNGIDIVVDGGLLAQVY